MSWSTIVMVVFLGFFGVKTIFFDFPGAMKSNNRKQYLVNVLIIVLVLATLSGIGCLFGGVDFINFTN